MSAEQFTEETVSQNRWAYLKMVYGLCGFNTFFYLLRLNFEFHVPQYNVVLFPIWILGMILPPLFVVFLKSYTWAAITVCGITSLLTSILIYLGGGIEAPGLLWVASYPLVLGVLLGLKGARVGYLVVVLNMLVFFLCDRLGIGPHIVAEFGNLKEERILNVFAFFLFVSTSAHFYSRREVKFTASLMRKNLDVENILRLLLHDIANTISRMTYNLIRHKEGQEDAIHITEIDKLEKAMEEITSLLVQVRHLKSLKDGKSNLPLKGTSLPMVLHEVYELAESIAQQKGIKISLSIARDRMMVNGDKTLLSSVVLMNLLSNAIKFSHPGDRIDLRAYVQKDQVFVEVQDYGIGIPEEILANIFSLGHRTSRAGTQGEGGTGYGLPLLKECLQLMGGKIEVISSESQGAQGLRGTLVKVTMPIVVTEALRAV